MHPRSRHKEYLDYRDLAKRQPSLSPFVFVNAYGGASIDYTDEKALRELSRCLLLELYGLSDWSLPEGFLCPPVPQRADYIHGIADLLAGPNGDVLQGLRGLDVGTGASCIYCLLGHQVYGWRFLGSDADAEALRHARSLVAANGLEESIELRRQRSKEKVFEGLLKDGETFAFCVCNPPFHESLEQARLAGERKWQRLGRQAELGKNYCGREAELCCEGGELGFVGRMAEESAALPEACVWFSAMLSRESSVAPVRQRLKELGAKRRCWELRQGRMVKWVVAWSFMGPEARATALAAMAEEAATGEAAAEEAGRGKKRRRKGVDEVPAEAVI